MKIHLIGLYGTLLGFIFFLFLKLMNNDTTGATAIIFFSLGIQIGSLAKNNGGL